jgi:hypothetical protein
VTLEHLPVVAFESQAGERREAWEAMVAPVPAQLAVAVLVLRERRVGGGVAVIGRQDPHLVARRPQVLDGPAPDELVPAEVMGWVQVPDAQDPHRERA